MKKTLLLASAVALLASSASAIVKDPAKYADVNDITIENLWLYSLKVPTGEITQTADGPQEVIGNFESLPFGGSNYSRMACICGDKIYVAETAKPIVDGKAVSRASYHIIDLETGKYEGQVFPTVNGEYIDEGDPLCANSIGMDDYGNLWFAPFRGTLFSTVKDDDGVVVDVTIYPFHYFHVVNPATGECEAHELTLDEDVVDAHSGVSRIDYIDLVGDCSGKECSTTVIAPSQGDKPYVWGWYRDQGEEEFGQFFSGSWTQAIKTTCPADLTTWGSAGVAYIVRDEDSSAGLYYIDGFNTVPVLYSADGGEALDGFQNVAADLVPKTGTNGICEFSLGDKDFIAYSYNQYVAPGYCNVIVAELGENMSFEGMAKYWDIPEGGLGAQSDAGNRVHSLRVKKFVDENGKEAVDLLTYKCRNGLGVYRVAQKGYEAGVNDIAVDNSNAPVEYFNLQGVRVPANNLTTGIYVTRQGNKTAKVLVK